MLVRGSDVGIGPRSDICSFFQITSSITGSLSEYDQLLCPEEWYRGPKLVQSSSGLSHFLHSSSCLTCRPEYGSMRVLVAKASLYDIEK